MARYSCIYAPELNDFQRKRADLLHILKYEPFDRTCKRLLTRASGYAIVVVNRRYLSPQSGKGRIMAGTIKHISLKATQEDVSLLEAIQQRWGLSQSDALRFCMRDTLRRAHSRKRKAAQQPGAAQQGSQKAA
jgi:hypothetical protein